MVLVVRNPILRILIPLIIFGIIYLTVIKPSTDTANRALTNATQQLNNGVQQTNKATHGAVPTSVQTLAACVAAAGTDSGKIQACNAKYQAAP